MYIPSINVVINPSTCTYNIVTLTLTVCMLDLNSNTTLPFAVLLQHLGQYT